MSRPRTILAVTVLLAGCQAWPLHQVAPAAAPIATPAVATQPLYPATGAPPAVILPSPPYIQPSPTLIQPVPEAAVVFPPPAPVVQLPSQTPGSIFGPPAVPVAPQPTAVPISPLAHIAPGGSISPQFGLPQGPEITAGPPNPISVPVADENLAWDQIADVVSDYFRIGREQRARRGGEVAMEGFLETVPQTGATWLEPHRRDSVGNFNRWESTFQTIRRRALVRVVPDATGYLVEVIVEKELEDLPQPERATAGAATFRNDTSLPSRRLEQPGRIGTSPRWIPLGRDPPLEQRMLAEIHARLTGVAAGPGSVFTP